jgi:hypothetical protein
MKEVTPQTPEKVQIPVADKTQTIANHKLAATHHEEAAKHHLNAAKHVEAGNNDKACACTVKASGHALQACEARDTEAKAQATSIK